MQDLFCPLQCKKNPKKNIFSFLSEEKEYNPDV
jgi:hypothetical protein